MAQKVVVSLVDDNRRGQAAETVGAPRRAGSGGTRRRGASTAARSTGDREQNQAIRDWARQHGHAVSDRGRVPSEVIEAYQQAS
jgi:hypothetical protein